MRSKAPFRHALSLFALPLGLLFAGGVAAQPQQNPGNGNWYEVVPAEPALNWSGAQTAAAGRIYLDVPGHLVTITSQQESDFLRDQMDIPVGAWIGARQHSEGTEPGELWEWVTAETWSFTAWAPGEPNDANNNEDCGHWWSPDGTWNDINCLDTQGAYVVEYEGDVVAREARFAVAKAYTDGRVDEVQVTLTCNGGLPLQQDFAIAGNEQIGVVFVVTNLPESGADCEVTESGGPDGYTPVFNSGEGCAWQGVTGGYYICEILNQADPAEFTVTKHWVIEGAGDDVLQQADIRIYCNNFITDGYYSDYPGYGYEYHAVLSGDGDSVTVEVDTNSRPAECIAEERISQSGVESENGCDARTIPAGGSSSCTITNTVFFEGIPTLSQWGMALLALLMLGMGLVGLRRFV